MRLRAALLAVVLLVLAAGPAAADTWYESYHRAEEAIANERWSEAIRHLNQALEEKPESSAQARTYGMRFVPYFPYLKLGIAYYHLGQVDAALQAFETEERQGEIERSSQGRGALQTYRDLIQQGKQEAEAEAQRRAQRVVGEGLAAARDLEEQGRLDDALSALATVLALKPDHSEATAARQRLLATIAERQRQQERDERCARLVEQGRTELAAGRHSQAAATLTRALELRDDGEARGLLEQAQQRIRAELEARRDGEERQLLVERSLARAAQLEAAGELVKALSELQAVLVLAPDNPAARSLEARVVQAQAASEEAAGRSATVQRLLAEAEQLLAAGEHDQALRSANRALALEPTNAAALRCTAQVYARLSATLLATDNAPPAILIDDLGEGVAGLSADGVSVIRSPELVVTGTVYDSTPVELGFLDGDQPAGRARVHEREFQGIWITDFRLVHRVPPGVSTLTVVATDRGGQDAREQLSVEYVVPFVRSRWFGASILAAVGLVGLGLFGWRARRRRQLLSRRFNPYIAGAPILEQQRFFGRQRLLDYVLRRIANNSILLYGERRIGKTSFQHQLKRCLTSLDDPEHQFYPVFIDLQGTPEEKFFSTMAADIFHELGPLIGGEQPSPAADRGTYGYRDFVKDIHRVLKALDSRSSKKTKVVLLIDEVDELNDYDPRLNQKLRSLFMRTFADSLVSVVSGVAIKKHWDREGSPWYNFFQEVEVRALEREAARELVEAPVRGVFTFAAGVADEIVRRTEGKPYLIQRLCSELVDRLHEERRRTVTLADVETVSQALELA